MWGHRWTLDLVKPRRPLTFLNKRNYLYVNFAKNGIMLDKFDIAFSFRADRSDVCHTPSTKLGEREIPNRDRGA